MNHASTSIKLGVRYAGTCQGYAGLAFIFTLESLAAAKRLRMMLHKSLCFGSMSTVSKTKKKFILACYFLQKGP